MDYYQIFIIIYLIIINQIQTVESLKNLVISDMELEFLMLELHNQIRFYVMNCELFHQPKAKSLPMLVGFSFYLFIFNLNITIND